MLSPQFINVRSLARTVAPSRRNRNVPVMWSIYGRYVTAALVFALYICYWDLHLERSFPSLAA